MASFNISLGENRALFNVPVDIGFVAITVMLVLRYAAATYSLSLTSAK